MNRNSSGCLIAIVTVVLVVITRNYFLALIGLGIYLILSGSRGGRAREHNTSYSMPLADPVLVLFAAMMKADGRIMRSELDYTRGVLRRLYGPNGVQPALLMLRDLLSEPLPIAMACQQIRMQMSHAQRVMLMQMLFGLAQADGNVHPREHALLDTIGHGIGLNSSEYTHMWDTYTTRVPDYYSVLGITSDATNSQVRDAYRKLAMQWHPDKFTAQGEEQAKAAAERFKAINEAYEAIRKQRGLK